MNRRTPVVASLLLLGAYPTSASLLSFVDSTEDRIREAKGNADKRNQQTVIRMDLFAERLISGVVYFCLLLILVMTHAEAEPTTIDLGIGETYLFSTKTGEDVPITLISTHSLRDEMRSAIRSSEVLVKVGSDLRKFGVALDNLPVEIGTVKLDAVVTRDYIQNSNAPEIYNLDDSAEVRLRIWDRGEPLLTPGTFAFPLKERWPKSSSIIYPNEVADERTRMSGLDQNEVYYHWAIDLGGYDGRSEIISATDGEIISVGEQFNNAYRTDEFPFFRPSYGTIQVIDGRGWIHQYTHLHFTLPNLNVGDLVRKGQLLGFLGKEGDSGGWSHLHYGIFGTKEDDKGFINPYPFLVDSYIDEHPRSILAVAGPHRYVSVGSTVQLSALNSVVGPNARYEWKFHDGTRISGPVVSKTYPRPGVFSEQVNIEDEGGIRDRDFVSVYVYAENDFRASGYWEKFIERLRNSILGKYLENWIPKNVYFNGEMKPPTMHASSWPTIAIVPKQTVYFKVRTFNVRGWRSKELWDFGDGTTGETQSWNDYATISHQYESAGVYVVTIMRSKPKDGAQGMAQLEVIVNKPTK